MEQTVAPLTERQRHVLNVIRTFVADRGESPTVKELTEALGFSSNYGTQRHLSALERKGYIEIQRGHARGIRLAHTAQGRVSVPLVGEVPAGPPLEALESVEVIYEIPPDVFDIPPHHRVMALRVKGDSMQDSGIYEDDVVVVDTDAEVQNGDVVVAVMDGEATVKTIELKPTKTILKPNNPVYAPIEINHEKSQCAEFRIVGPVIALWRTRKGGML